MAARRACTVFVVAGLVIASCSSEAPDDTEANTVVTSSVAEVIQPDVTDSVGTSETEPPTTESPDSSVAQMPAGALYLPSEIPDGWGIRSVTILPGDGAVSAGEVRRSSFIAHPVDGGYEAGGVNVSVVEFASAEDAGVATAAGQMGLGTTIVPVAGFGDGVADAEDPGFSALSVSQGRIGVVLVGTKPIADLVLIAEGLRIETDVAGAPVSDRTAELDLAGWELADGGTFDGSYDIEIGGPGGSISIAVSPGLTRASLYASGSDLESVLEGDRGEGYVAVQQNESDGSEFPPRIVWWVPDVLLRAFPATDPDLVASVVDSFVEVDEAAFVERTADASFVAIEPESPPPVENPPDPGSTSPGRSFDEARLDVLTEFIEEFVGRSFENRPEVSLIDRSALTGEVPPGTFVSESQWNLYRALGLIAADADRLAAEAVRIEQVRGVCCPVQVVEQSDPYFNEVVIVHEMTHGLDTELNTGGRASNEPVDPVRSLVEGNAHRVAFAYRDVLQADGGDLPVPPAVFSEVDDPLLPDVIRELLEFPYDEGRLFALALVERGGEQAVVDAFADPPRTSEQILDVDAYLAGETAITVTAPIPPDGSPSLSTGSLGAFTLQQLLERSQDPNAASALAATWDGDEYSLYGDTDAPCIIATIVVDDESSANTLAELLRDDDLETVQNDVVHTGTSITLTRCAA